MPLSGAMVALFETACGLSVANIYYTQPLMCGAFGSALAAAIYVHGGWVWVAVAGAGCVAVGLAFYATEFRRGAQVGVSA